LYSVHYPLSLHDALPILAIAPIYMYSELGFSHLLGDHTDVAIGLAGGGFADDYSEVRRGNYFREESFDGHSAEISGSIYHTFNRSEEHTSELQSLAYLVC